jgi:hypothetical protein
MTDCTSPSGSESGQFSLPTRQKNALRLLLNKPDISPREVAALDYLLIERAPGIGKKSLEIIDAWLKQYGYKLGGQPKVTGTPRLEQKKRKLEQAIDFLLWNGYEIRPPL